MIRAILLLAIICAKPMLASAQIHTVVSAERMKIVYVGVHNQLKVVAEKIPCKALWLQCDNGKIEKRDDCLFDFVPVEARPTTIYVCKIAGRDTIKVESTELRAKRIPEPIAAIASNRSGRRYFSGTIKSDSLKRQERILSYIEGFDFDVEGAYPIKHFTMTIISKSGACQRIASSSASFTREHKLAINSVRSGDVVLFTGITALHDGAIVQLQPLELSVE